MHNFTEDKHKLLNALLKNAPFDGWSDKAIANSATALGWEPGYPYILFPNGMSDILGCFHQYIDDLLAKRLITEDLANMRIRDRIFTVAKARISLLTPYRAAIKRLLIYYAMPAHINYLTKFLWQAVDKIWIACGDQSNDYNYYTKRLLLAGVYVSTIIFWANDTSPNQEASWNYLSRKLNDVLKIRNVKSSVQSGLNKIPFLRLILKKHFRNFNAEL